jgi:DNA gyrase subunit A
LTTPAPTEPANITPIALEVEMRRSYLDYAMSVIVSRALPDVRDGLKPVHRRILYAMKEAGYDWNRPFRKSARVVGEVMGKYHPHGDAAIYDAMVRMAQLFSMRLPLIEGQGNFGSMDGDPPAAMRYTEARLARVAEMLLADFDRDTVDFQENYDASSREPMVLPARFPNLLVNGAGGIAVGMATNIPPHNLEEVIDAACALIDNPEISIDGLMEHLPGPDFPTGGIILGRSGIHSAYHTGRGSIVVRGRTHIETVRKERQAIIVTEVPYHVNKARMIERLAELVRDKQIEGISDLRDESDRHGVRVVIEVRRDTVPEVVLNQIYRYTPLQTSFGVNMLAIRGGRPQLLNLKEVLSAFLTFREEVITRRTIFDLGKARARAHILVGLALAVANIDQVIVLIRKSPDPETARRGLTEQSWPAESVVTLIELVDEPGSIVEGGRYRFSETQARAILELRLQRLTGLEREKIAGELHEIAKRITDYLEILSSRERLLKILREEMIEVRERFGNPRRTALEEGEFEQDIEQLIQREDMVVTVTPAGYIKRVPLSTYRAQRRGGKGRTGMSTRDKDFVSRVFVVNTHTPVLFFSSLGRVYKLKVYRLPVGLPQARGKALINLLPLAEGETITTLMPLPEDEENWGNLNLMFATSKAHVRRNLLSDFLNVKANGKIAMKLDGDEKLVRVRTCSEDENVLLVTRGGKCIRFRVADVRVFSGRNSVGVRGIRLEKGDEVIGISILRHVDVDTEIRDDYLRLSGARRRAATGNGGDPANIEIPEGSRLTPAIYEELSQKEEFILSGSENGYGKRTSAYEYRITKRGGKGIQNMELERRNDAVIAVFPVEDSDQVMLVTDGGQLIRCPVLDIGVMGRRTQGVTLFRIGPKERVVSVAHLAEVDEENPEEDAEEAGGENPEEAGKGDEGNEGTDGGKANG